MEPLAAAVRARRYSAATGQWGAVMTLDSAPVDNPVRVGPGRHSARRVSRRPRGSPTATAPTSASRSRCTRSSQAADGGAWSTVQSRHRRDIADRVGLAPARGRRRRQRDARLVRVQPSTTPAPSTRTGPSSPRRAGPSGVFGAPVTLSDPMLLSDSPRVATTPAGRGHGRLDAGGLGPDQRPDTARRGIVPSRELRDEHRAEGPVAEHGAHPGDAADAVHVAARRGRARRDVVVAFGRSDETMTMLAEAVYRPGGKLAGRTRRRRPRRCSRRRARRSAPGTARASRSTARATPSSPGRATRSSRQPRSTSLPPAFAGVNVPATGSTGQPIAMSAPTLDTWSALGAGQPAWNFGDGNPRRRLRRHRTSSRRPAPTPSRSARWMPSATPRPR